MTEPHEPAQSSHEKAMRTWIDRLNARLQGRREAHLYRELTAIESAQGPTIIVRGRRYLQFCTNNYLGLASDPEVIDAAKSATARFGTGSGASRLVAGSMELHHELERTLAEWKHAEAALLMSSGFMANLAVLTTLAGRGDRILSDKLNHASLLDAAKFSEAECRAFGHRDYQRAGELLARSFKEIPHDGNASNAEPRAKFLVTDTVFSMDGDIADLRAACDVAEAHAAMVITDEAHATGVLGETGSGLAEFQQESRVAVSVGTMSKALGSIGGFVTGPRAVIETLINEARPFIYTTALPPAASAAALAAIRIIHRDPARRQRVLRLSAWVKRELDSFGFRCGDSVTPIIPVLMEDAPTALAAAARLRERGIWVPAIRPPTVKEARLRISLMATHSDGDVENLLREMKSLAPKSPTA